MEGYRHAVKAYRVDRIAGAVARYDDRCRANPASGSAAGAFPNPSSSLVLPAPHEVPVSPVTPGRLPGSTAPGVGDAAGIYATQPMGVFHHHHRRRHYSR